MRHSIAFRAVLVFATTSVVALVVSPVRGGATEAAQDTTPSTEIRTQRDEDIATAVSHVLADDTRVQAMNVKVAVEHGVVTLTGSANNAAERQAAEDLSRRVAGVRDVENRLVIAEKGSPAPGASVIPEVPSAPAK
jgi:osmotically-inducible protein OsmY